MFSSTYRNKRVLITGHTGFKGSWLTAWLLNLGANVCGISDRIPTTPSMFKETGLASKIHHHFCDIRDHAAIEKIIFDFKPDYLFHLAAQAIVSKSYESPLETISTNVMGTGVLLDVLRKYENPCNIVVITSDKCYENVEWEWGYKETDRLGGKDIYSASKGAAEIIFHAYYHSFFKKKPNIRIASARAGNVIGGGDWAKDRIVADCIKEWEKGNPVEIRSPNSTRPWQHVLEPLSGYLLLGSELSKNENLNGESFNFGPKSEQSRKVIDLLQDLYSNWKQKQEHPPYIVTDNIPFHEAGLLKLNCDKALFHLKWESNLNYHECIKFISDWYTAYYFNNEEMYSFTKKQIDDYCLLANKRGLIWA